MGLFKRKEEEIPELPDLPSFGGLPALPNSEIESPPGLSESLPDLDVEVNELPSLPEGDRSFSRGVKQAIKYPGMQKSVYSERFEPIRAEPISMFPQESVKRTRKSEPIYVRLDKFKTTVEAFEEIKSKVAEIERLLGNIKEIKSKEERELVEWENEIQAIKARIDAIDSGVFSKLD